MRAYLRACLQLTRDVAGVYLFDLTSDPTETTNLLWGLDFVTDAVASAAAAAAAAASDDDPGSSSTATTDALLQEAFTAAATAFCAHFVALSPAMWRQKEGAAKQVFRNNDYFVTSWEDTAINDGQSVIQSVRQCFAECLLL